MLTDASIKRSKPKEKPYKLADAQGLFLRINPNGSKLWQHKYRINGSERLASYGAYPDVSLAKARQLRDKTRENLRNSKDPSLLKKQEAVIKKSQLSLKELGEQWLENRRILWSNRHYQTIKNSLERHIWPSIGRLPSGEITAPMLLDVLQKAEKNSTAEQVRKFRQRVASIYTYGIACGIVSENPASHLQGALKPPVKKHQPAITSLPELQKMMRQVEKYQSSIVSQLALRFLALTATRSGEVRKMRWVEVDGETWSIPAERMKMKRDHIVPLSRQALEILDVMKEISGRFELVFPSPRWIRRSMSDNTLSILLRRAGYEGRHVPHGFRAAFSTIMNERYPLDRGIIDLMLAHVSKNKVEAAYNRASHLERRKELSQIWADLFLESAPSARDLMQRICC
ncbi:DUF4102 domain-containing protein [Acetobacteraceae bacterium]|nr:DUF4102 domain-containing protein [Acetobacteraceae bacterium]